jgi:leucine dehydrogenase
MNLFDAMTELSFGDIHVRRDPESGLCAIIAIHSTKRGPALGGARYVSYASQDDAIRDALRLGRGMTYKAALAGLPLGGGKAVLIRPEGLSPEQRQAQIMAFGRFVDSLGGRYITAEDSGTSLRDMDAIRGVTRFVSGTSHDGGDPSPYTAYGVLRGIQAASKFVFGRDDLTGLRVSIQGTGSVGYYLAKELATRGAKLIVADINPDRANTVALEFNAQIMSSADIIDADVDIYAPCALGGALTPDVVSRLRCKAVAGAANNQLSTPAVGDLLQSKNILYAPDYAINAGGLIQVASEWAKYDHNEVKVRCDQIYNTLLNIFQTAAETGKNTAVVADAKAEEALQ